MTRIYYFGPLKESGHHFFRPDGYMARGEEVDSIPWQDFEVDGKLPPYGDIRYREPQMELEGVARIHFKNGWTALSFWDRTIDKRYASSSTYLAEGTFTFEEIAALAKERFPERWGKMAFEVKLAQEPSA